MAGPPQRRRLDPLVLVRGLPGHPLHPPLTDATIGMFVLAAGLAIIGKARGIQLAAAKGMWLALLGGLIVAVPTALTGLVDWLSIEWEPPSWQWTQVAIRPDRKPQRSPKLRCPARRRPLTLVEPDTTTRRAVLLRDTPAPRP